MDEESPDMIRRKICFYFLKTYSLKPLEQTFTVCVAENLNKRVYEKTQLCSCL